MKDDFNPTRLWIAMKRRMSNPGTLSEQVGVKRSRVCRWLSGVSEPNSVHVDAIALALDWPRQFFFGPDLDIPTRESLSFRHSS